MQTAKENFNLYFPAQSFPFKIYTDRRKEPYIGKFHAHSFIVELQYIHSAAGFYFIKNRRYQLKDRTLFVIHDNDIHACIKKVPSAIIDKTSLYFSEILFDGFPSLRPLVKSITLCHGKFPHQIFFDAKEATEVEFILDILKREYPSENIHSREAIISGLLKIMIIIKRAMSKQAKRGILKNKHNVLVDKVVAYIDEHFKEPITLSMVAGHVCRSPCHTSSLFNTFTGVTLREYLINRRTIEAKRLLEKDVTRKIISVALDSGFSGMSTFYGNFKRLIGITPSQYRKMYASFHK